MKNMQSKIIIFFCLALSFLALLTVSCKKNENPPPKQNIVQKNTKRLNAYKFEIEKGAIFLEISLNNSSERANFILDTGTYPLSVMNSSFAEHIGVKSSKTVKTKYKNLTLSDIRNFTISTMPKFKINNFEQEELEVVIIDLKHFERIYQREIDGILGQNFLSHKTVVINYPEQELSLFEGFDLNPKNNAIRPIDFKKKQLPSLNIENGKKIFTVLIDTGFESSLALFDNKNTYSRGNKGTIEENSTVESEFIISELDIQINDTIRFLDAKPEGFDEEIDGVIGYSFLKNYILFIDYPNQFLRIHE